MQGTKSRLWLRNVSVKLKGIAVKKNKINIPDQTEQESGTEAIFWHSANIANNESK